MNYPPEGFTPAKNTPPVLNGRPAEGVHAQQVDRYATWLACRKVNLPNIPGNPYFYGAVSSPPSWYDKPRVSAFTAHMQLRFFCHGRGQISVTIDGNTDTVDVNNGTGLSGSHSIESAAWYETAAPFVITQQASPQDVVWSFSITDSSGTASLRVYTVRPVLFMPEATETLT